jgi:hypothetical protein
VGDSDFLQSNLIILAARVNGGFSLELAHVSSGVRRVSASVAAFDAWRGLSSHAA